MDAEERYAEEKFSIAVDSLATNPEGIRIRIHSAFLSFAPITADSFADPDLRRLYEALMAQLTSTPAQGSEGSVNASLAKMSDDECVKVAETILNIYDILREKRAEEDYSPDETVTQ
jgi:hypothetical protein